MNTKIIKDQRTQKRTIRIELERKGYSQSLDKYIDDVMKDLHIILEQREMEEEITIQITLE